MPSPCRIDLRLLVISADGREAVLPAIKQALDYLGTPYTVHIASERPGGLTEGFLSAPCHAFYQGVVLTTGDLGYFSPAGWRSALTPQEFTTLQQYQAAYGIRQVTWYTFPTPSYGFNWGTAVDTSVDPVSASFTAEGREIFSYVNTANPLAIRNAYTYLATPLDTQSTPSTIVSVTPLVVDASGHALMNVTRYTDGRHNLAVTFDGNQHLLHSIVLAYGLINWVTQGVFLGERYVFISPQVDDLLIHDARWHTSVPCGTPVDDTGFEYRITESDLLAVIDWQNTVREQPATGDLRLSVAFNGVGATGIYDPDDLTPAAQYFRRKFFWINHTHDHTNLDMLSYYEAKRQIRQNIRRAKELYLGRDIFDKRNLITPDVSGLDNPTFLKAAYVSGIRYLVSDTSRPGYSNPSPNVGIYNGHQPKILMIPRYPNNLFYNVATPEDWVAEYNCVYRSFWGRDLAYGEILEKESDILLSYLLKGDFNPWMFHQTNLAAYDGRHTLLTDLLDRTLAKYTSLYTLPIWSPPMHEVGELMADRFAYNAAAVTATLLPGQSITLTAANGDAWVPVTGLRIGEIESYGGQVIGHVVVNKGRTKRITLSP